MGALLCGDCPSPVQGRRTSLIPTTVRLATFNCGNFIVIVLACIVLITQYIHTSVLFGEFKSMFSRNMLFHMENALMIGPLRTLQHTRMTIKL